jgi:hypothetical protein
MAAQRPNKMMVRVVIKNKRKARTGGKNNTERRRDKEIGRRMKLMPS